MTQWTVNVRATVLTNVCVEAETVEEAIVMAEKACWIDCDLNLGEIADVEVNSRPKMEYGKARRRK